MLFLRIFGLFLLFSTILCGNIVFEDRELEEDETLRLKIGLITDEDAWVGDDTTSLSISQTFKIEEASYGQIQVLLYYSERANSIGYVTEDGMVLYCCTAELQKEGHCKVVGDVITNDDTFVQVLDVNFAGRTTAVLDKQYNNVTASGMYYVKYFNCPGSDVGTVKITGEVSWMNPFGHLSAELYPFLYFFAIMTVAYMVVGVIWIILSAIHWSKLLMLQNCISGVILLGMVECVTWYFDFLSYNITGNFNWGAIAIGVFTSTAKRTVSRLLVLAVSMGFGVVKANLGSDKHKVYFLGGVYFIISLIQQLILTYLREGDNEFLSFIATIIIFPAAMLDTIFYWWIFLSLMRTINQLKLRKQDVKLQMYTNFFVVLALGGVMTTLVILYQTLLVITSSEDAMWSTWWIFQAFWHLLYFSILLAIAYLWRPTTNNTRYAYVEAEDIEMMLPSKSVPGKKDIDTGTELHLDLDKFSSSFLDNDEEKQEELSKME
mmetsp:Transcript_3288/g.5405  ORF Transcript_3288/g.5405 Transcript_3288/m.5405 type:complete len:491 (-) Transcript_3288:20-1492(-)